ncbi:MAG: hypothetical protein Q9M36_11470 [Sulfurovum sp.]|nr:hypothetical protein [Sulfurovum sp.]
MFKSLKRRIKKMFREYLVHHHSSMEYRAKLLTLMISSNGEMCECEKAKLVHIAHSIYGEDTERAEILIDTVYEYHLKIITNNGLDFEDLIQSVERETKTVKRFAKKINLSLLKELQSCSNEDEALFQERILEFLANLQEENLA